MAWRTPGLSGTGRGGARPRPLTPETPPPDGAALELIRGPVREEIAETYPEFAALLAADARA